MNPWLAAGVFCFLRASLTSSGQIIRSLKKAQPLGVFLPSRRQHASSTQRTFLGR